MKFSCGCHLVICGFHLIISGCSQEWLDDIWMTLSFWTQKKKALYTRMSEPLKEKLPQGDEIWLLLVRKAFGFLENKSKKQVRPYMLLAYEISPQTSILSYEMLAEKVSERRDPFFGQQSNSCLTSFRIGNLANYKENSYLSNLTIITAYWKVP